MLHAWCHRCWLGDSHTYTYLSIFSSSYYFVKQIPIICVYMCMQYNDLTASSCPAVLCRYPHHRPLWVTAPGLQDRQVACRPAWGSSQNKFEKQTFSYPPLNCRSWNVKSRFVGKYFARNIVHILHCILTRSTANTTCRHMMCLY